MAAHRHGGNYTAMHREDPSVPLAGLVARRLAACWAEDRLWESPGPGFSGRDMRSRWAYSQVSARPELTAATLAVWEYYRGAARCDIARNAHVSQRTAKGLVSEMRRAAGLPCRHRTEAPCGDTQVRQYAALPEPQESPAPEGFHRIYIKGRPALSPPLDSADGISMLGEDVWEDTGDPVDFVAAQPCLRCGGVAPSRGEDACLGHIEGEGAEFACCWHGRMADANVVFEDRSVFMGEDALAWFRARGLGW